MKNSEQSAFPIKDESAGLTKREHCLINITSALCSNPSYFISLGGGKDAEVGIVRTATIITDEIFNKLG